MILIKFVKYNIFLTIALFLILFFIGKSFAEDSFILLEWEPNEGASQYLVEISNTKNFSTIVYSTRINETSLRINYNDKYKYGRVAGIDKIGATGNFSKTFEIQPRIVIPKALPETVKPIAISEPVPIPEVEPVYYNLSDIISLESSDRESEIFYQLNSSPWRRYMTPFYLDKDGLNEVYYYSINKLGKKELIQKKTYLVDSSEPEIHLGIKHYFVKEDNVYLTGPNTVITVNIVDLISGVKSWNAQFEYEDKIIPLNREEIIYIPAHLNDKRVFLVVTAEDKKGNISKKSISFIHDSAPPEIQVIMPNLINRLYTNVGSEIKIAAKDSGIGLLYIHCSINNSEYRDCINPLTLNNPGEFIIKIKAADWYGNAREITLDKIIVLEKEKINTNIHIQNINYIK
ncbi:MAG TPA: hypothetical protein PK079_05220 [Leptospiraceae bacterium]|nr:hypothetical protein [Leptospiraceae bacterium]HMW06272.1 hypothetical protein [Leptospiraceae bacterium]HMX33167.1 hypothetical protein [Leptospiraceae bacterium]HMY31734.1 hypothetical protein [Leptospiraceae bacterium]HMZ64527.1 hypothetical protein [Leptospiraceae bacterium]